MGNARIPTRFLPDCVNKFVTFRQFAKNAKNIRRGLAISSFLIIWDNLFDIVHVSINTNTCRGSWPGYVTGVDKKVTENDVTALLKDVNE